MMGLRMPNESASIPHLPVLLLQPLGCMRWINNASWMFSVGLFIPQLVLSIEQLLLPPEAAWGMMYEPDSKIKHPIYFSSLLNSSSRGMRDSHNSSKANYFYFFQGSGGEGQRERQRERENKGKGKDGIEKKGEEETWWRVAIHCVQYKWTYC